jgi:hypothetical protein
MKCIKKKLLILRIMGRLGGAVSFLEAGIFLTPERIKK